MKRSSACLGASTMSLAAMMIASCTPVPDVDISASIAKVLEYAPFGASTACSAPGPGSEVTTLGSFTLVKIEADSAGNGIYQVRNRLGRCVLQLDHRFRSPSDAVQVRVYPSLIFYQDIIPSPSIGQTGSVPRFHFTSYYALTAQLVERWTEECLLSHASTDCDDYVMSKAREEVITVYTSFEFEGDFLSIPIDYAEGNIYWRGVPLE